MGWEMGFEPTIFGTTIRRFNRLSYTHHINLAPDEASESGSKKLRIKSSELARLTGFEPVAYCLEGSYSIQLS